MISKGSLSGLYDESKVYELENKAEGLSDKEQKKLDAFNENKEVYDEALAILRNNASDKVWLNVSDFEVVIEDLLVGTIDKKYVKKVVDGLSQMDKNAEIQRDKKGIIWDKETKDTEIVPWKQSIEDYMAKEVLPHVPDAQWFFEGKDQNASFMDDRGQKIIKIGAEIPFTRYFYKYQQPTPSEELLAKFIELDKEVDAKIKELLG